MPDNQLPIFDRSGELDQFWFSMGKIQKPGDQLQRVIESFQRKWGVPQCVGAIVGCHIPIAVPIRNHTEYYNRKGLLLHAVTRYC